MAIRAKKRKVAKVDSPMFSRNISMELMEDRAMMNMRQTSAQKRVNAEFSSLRHEHLHAATSLDMLMQDVTVHKLDVDATKVLHDDCEQELVEHEGEMEMVQMKRAVAAGHVPTRRVEGAPPPPGISSWLKGATEKKKKAERLREVVMERMAKLKKKQELRAQQIKLGVSIEWRVESGEWRVESEEWRVELGVGVLA
jgi:hypothetical protein